MSSPTDTGIDRKDDYRYPFRHDDLTCHRIKCAHYRDDRLHMSITFAGTCFTIFLTKEEMLELMGLTIEDDDAP